MKLKNYNQKSTNKNKLLYLTILISALMVSAVYSEGIILGKLIKKVSIEKNDLYDFVLGDPANVVIPNLNKKPLVTYDKNGSFTISTGSKVKTAPKVDLPIKIKNNQEVVITINNVKRSSVEKEWVAIFVGIRNSNKTDYGVSCIPELLAFRQELPERKSIGKKTKVKYPIVLQIRRQKKMLQFFVEGKKRFEVEETDDAIDTPYFYIKSKVTTGWGVLEIASCELRKVK